MLGPSLAPSDRSGEFEPLDDRRLTTVHDCLEAKMSEGSLTTGHDNRTVCSQRNGCTVFRREGARKWPDRFALLDGNFIVLGKFMSLVTAY